MLVSTAKIRDPEDRVQIDLLRKILEKLTELNKQSELLEKILEQLIEISN